MILCRQHCATGHRPALGNPLVQQRQAVGPTQAASASAGSGRAQQRARGAGLTAAAAAAVTGSGSERFLTQTQDSTDFSDDDYFQRGSSRGKMSNHFTLKPSAVGSTAQPDYRLTPPNVDLTTVPDYLKKDCLLFYYPDCEQLARNIVEVSAGNVELAEINWKRFADGFPNLFVKDAIRIRNRHVAFLASFSSPEVIFEQISIIYQLPRLFVGSFTLVLPYFPTGTAERVEAEGDVATAFTLARIISNIPLARGGPASVVIFDIHALQERFYFGDQVLPLFESGIPLLRQRLQQLPDADNITIAYPDEGAWKRFHYQFGDYPEVICTKVRDGDKRIVRLKEGNPRGRHVVIVDDLVQSGGTLIECQRLLATQGASAVSAYVTHGVFPNESYLRFSASDKGSSDGFAYFWITDSCPRTVAAVTDRKPFEVLSLAEPIAAALQI